MTDADASDIFEDTSDENIDAVTFGKVRGCTNYGAVDADLNVGGIAGAMAIEYELDPEGDQKESSSVFDRVYETKAVVQHCVNRGSISGKKDCIGGIVGEMDLGIVLSCEAYGSARSETGSRRHRGTVLRRHPLQLGKAHAFRQEQRGRHRRLRQRGHLLVSRLRLHGDRLPQPRCR